MNFAADRRYIHENLTVAIMKLDDSIRSLGNRYRFHARIYRKNDRQFLIIKDWIRSDLEQDHERSITSRHQRNPRLVTLRFIFQHIRQRRYPQLILHHREESNDLIEFFTL